ncbi:hypothetical protein HDO33_001279 [Staphylococcus pseudintermedius]|nr:hypothetical protein [Staphylococcus pseudintermedius]
MTTYMPLKLVSNYNSEFMQEIINQINVTLEDIESSSTIEIEFDNESNYTRYQFQNNKLHIKNILPNLISLLGIEDGVDIFICVFNEGFYEVLTSFIDPLNLDNQFEEYKIALTNYLFTPNGKLRDILLFKLHTDKYIVLDERKYRNISVNTLFGSIQKSINYKFHTESNSFIDSLDNMLDRAFTIKNGLERKNYVSPKQFSSLYSKKEWCQ